MTTYLLVSGLVFLVAVAAQALFAGYETGFISCNPIRVRFMAEEEKVPRARRLLWFAGLYVGGVASQQPTEYRDGCVRIIVAQTACNLQEGQFVPLTLVSLQFFRRPDCEVNLPTRGHASNCSECSSTDYRVTVTCSIGKRLEHASLAADLNKSVEGLGPNTLIRVR